MPTITTTDGLDIFFKDWGQGQPIVFSHGWPLSSDDWDNQMLFFLSQGYRVIAHDRLRFRTRFSTPQASGRAGCYGPEDSTRPIQESALSTAPWPVYRPRKCGRDRMTFCRPRRFGCGTWRR